MTKPFDICNARRHGISRTACETTLRQEMAYSDHLISNRCVAPNVTAGRDRNGTKGHIVEQKQTFNQRSPRDAWALRHQI